MLKEHAPIEQSKLRPSSSGMDFRFLLYLASKGAVDIHPLGPAASRALIEPRLFVLDKPSQIHNSQS